MTERYRCWLYLTEIRKDCELLWSRYVKLSFIPQKDITLQFSDDDNSGWDFHPHNVIYNVPDDVFWCYSRIDPFDCPCKPEDNCCITTEASKEWMRKAGWELEEELREEKRTFRFDGMWGKHNKYATKIEAE